MGKRGRSLDSLLEDGQGSQGKGEFGDANPVVASKWEVRVSLADASNREIPIPLSKLNTDRMGAVEVTPVTQTLMGKDIMSQFDEQQTGQREVRQVLRGNLFRAAEKYGKQGHVINATVAGGSIEPMMLLPRGYNIQQELSESPVELPEACNVRQFFEITHREGIIKTSDEQITIKAAENSGEYFLETGKKQKDVYLDQNLIEAVGGEFYTVSDRFQVVMDSEDRLEAVVSYIQQGRNQRLEAVTHLDQARELIGETIPEFAWSDSVEDVIEKAGLPPSVDLSNVADVRDRLEALWQPEESKPADGEVDSTIEPEVSAYRPDPDGPTTIGRERARLMNAYSEADSVASEQGVERANAIAARDDELEALAEAYGEDAGISFTHPAEQDAAIAARDIRYSGQPDANETPLDESPHIAGWRQQVGGPEKHVAKLLEEAGLADAVMADREFYLKIENEPFIPLTIERHDEQLILYHTLVQGGDAYVDSEMIFALSEEGTLALTETAVQNPAMGRSSGCDRSFAYTFAQNLRHQGFAEAAAKAVQSEQDTVLAACQQLAGDTGTRVYLSDLRQQLDMPREDVDVVLGQLERDRKIVLYPLDNPPEITPERAAAAIDYGSGAAPRHILYVQPSTLEAESSEQAHVRQKVAEVQSTIERGTNVILTANIPTEGQPDTVSSQRILLNSPNQIRFNAFSQRVEVTVDDAGAFFPAAAFLEHIDDELAAAQQRKAGLSPEVSETTDKAAGRSVGFNDDWSRLFYEGNNGINSLSTTEPEREAVSDALLTLHHYDALKAQLENILEGAVPPNQLASAADAIIVDQAPAISGREVDLSAPDEPTSEKDAASPVRQAHSLGRVAHFAAAADAERVTDDMLRAEERAQSAMPEPQYVTSAYDRALGLPQGKLTDSIHTIISYRQPGFSPLVHRAIDQYLPELIQTQMSVEDALHVRRTYDSYARQNSFEDTATGDLERIAWNRAIEVLADAVASGEPQDPSLIRQIKLGARAAEKIGAVDYPIGFEPQGSQSARLSAAEPPSLPELFEKADAIAAQPIDQEPSSPFDYQQTLERLREDTQALPEPLRDSILNAIQEAEAQMSEEPQLPADASLEKVSAGGLVQAAIAQNDPDSQDQMLNAGGTGVPSVEEFRDWYRKAAVMDRSAEVLSQIERMGRQAKAGTLVVEGFDSSAMQSDLAEYDQQASLAADMMPNVCRFLDEAIKAGVAMQSEEHGTVAEGRHYRVMAKAGMIAVENKETSGKLSFTERGIVEVSELTETDKNRWQRLGALEASKLTISLSKRSQPVQSELT
ncbi:MAG: hypothetical protein F6J95_030825 [Leptolyngbya sp. SIO1E4]|nr:hypothetical protein [Leptolyngbya sp. SIO1E4]